MRLFLAILATALVCTAQPTPETTTFEGRPGYKLSNGKLELTVLKTGATLSSLTLVDDSGKVNALWNPAMLARETKQPPRFGNSIGHFVCVDGFGGVSPEERKAGLSSHGEAYSRDFSIKRFDIAAGTTTLEMTAELPAVQETLTRTMTLRDGENVLFVRTRLESGVAFDRPISWAEHATIGAPFLERGVTVVDLPAKRSKTRPYTAGQNHRLASDKDFVWPNAPLVSGGTIDLRAAPAEQESGDHTTSSMDLAKKHAWATALHPGKKLLIGWIWRSADFPWIQNWEFYPKNGMLARGLEFSTQPFDIPRREAVALSGLFETPTFRWLPAKSAIETDFIIFFSTVPDGFTGVSDVRLDSGAIIVEDGRSKKTLTLKTAGTL